MSSSKPISSSRCFSLPSNDLPHVGRWRSATSAFEVEDCAALERSLSLADAALSKPLVDAAWAEPSADAPRGEPSVCSVLVEVAFTGTLVSAEEAADEELSEASPSLLCVFALSFLSS